MINVSNSTSKNNPPWLLGEPVRPLGPAGPAPPAPPRASARTATRTEPPGLGRTLITAGRALLSWLVALPRRLADRLFVMNDAEAYWRSWQIIRTPGGLTRRYRDPRFDTLAECPQCRGAGSAATLPCPPCAGTGRITLGDRITLGEVG